MKKLISILCILAMLLSGVALAEDKEVTTLQVYFSAPLRDAKWVWGADPTTRWITEQTGIALDVT